MCEIAVVVVDTINPDFYLNCKRYKAGDVIDVLPDGWKWGKEELSNPKWRILKFPGIPVEAFSQFLTPQLPSDPKNPSKTLLKRAVSFNYSALPTTPSVAANAVMAAKVDPYMRDAARKTSTMTVPLAASDIATVSVFKALVPDPTVIGVSQGNVIG